MKQSKTEKAVFAKLSTEKVELSNIDFLNAIISDSKRITNRSVKFAEKREAFTKEARVLNADAKAMLNGGRKLIAEFESNAKELGLNPNTLQEYKKAVDAMGAMDTTVQMTKLYTRS